MIFEIKKEVNDMADKGRQLTDEEFAVRLEKYKNMSSQNKRRTYLGVQVNCWDNKLDYFFKEHNPRYIRNYSFLLDSFVGDGVLSRYDRWEMLRRARSFLSRRSVSDLSNVAFRCDKSSVSTVLDLFPALSHSYNSPLPARVVAKKRGLSVGSGVGERVCYLDFCCSADGSSKKARFHDLSRSGSIRLDPVDAPRQLFLYRRRIQRCISWGYSVGLVPLMMTVTVFHRWHPLRGLLNVLSKAWNYFFTASTAAVKRSKRMGLVGYIRRAEETINNTSGGYNSGWHPHYHVILFVPADKVSVVASMEDELREAWFLAVNRFFEKEFGETIDPSYERSFREHGLFFSKDNGHGRVCHFDYLTDVCSFDKGQSFSIVNDGSSNVLDELSGKYTHTPPTAKKFSRARAGGVGGSNGAVLRHVDDSGYMTKVMGCVSPSVYCGDNEMTATCSKSSKIPFDLLLEDTAENNDLWVEYALATKGVRSFVFSHGLEARVKKYFEAHPERDPLEPFVKNDKVIAQLDVRLYKVIERNFKVDEMMRAAVKGYDALREWFKAFYLECGIPADAIYDSMYPCPPDSYTPFGDPIVHSRPVGIDTDSVESQRVSLDDLVDEQEQDSALMLESESSDSESSEAVKKYVNPLPDDGSPVSRAMGVVFDAINEFGIDHVQINSETFRILCEMFEESDKATQESDLSEAQRILDEFNKEMAAESGGCVEGAAVSDVVEDSSMKDTELAKDDELVDLGVTVQDSCLSSDEAVGIEASSSDSFGSFTNQSASQDAEDDDLLYEGISKSVINPEFLKARRARKERAERLAWLFSDI